MKKSDITALIKSHLREVIPALENEEISIDRSFASMGASSLDVAEITLLTIESLELQVPPNRFKGAENISQVADIMHEEMTS